MRISTKARYATSALLDIALYSKGSPVSVADISKREHLSADYLEQLFRKLKKSGLVTSQKGSGGGYILVDQPEKISLKSIFEAVGEPLSPVFCLELNSAKICLNSKSCPTRNCWQQFELAMNNFLQSMTLAQLVENSQSNGFNP